MSVRKSATKVATIALLLSLLSSTAFVALRYSNSQASEQATGDNLTANSSIPYPNQPKSSLTFIETGLPIDSKWEVTLGVETLASSNSTLAVELLDNWVYPWELHAPIYAGNGTRYISGNDSGYLKIASSTDIQISFSTQYLLTVYSINNSQSSKAWYTAGSTVSLAPENVSGYEFEYWSCTGLGCYAGSKPTPTITINAPIVEYANYIHLQPIVRNVSVTFSSNLPNGTYWQANLAGYGTVNSSKNTIEFPNVIPGNYAWNVSSVIVRGSDSRFGANQSAGSVSVSSNLTMLISYASQYFVSVSSTVGSTVGGGWYNANSMASLGVSSPDVRDGTGSRKGFDNWSCSGENCYSGSASTFNIRIVGPVSEHANWVQEYYLRVGSTVNGPSLTPHSGWYENGTIVALNAQKESGLYFKGWSGIGKGSYSGNDLNTTLMVCSPIVETALYFSVASQLSITKTILPTGVQWTLRDNGTANSYLQVTVMIVNVSTRAHMSWSVTLYPGTSTSVVENNQNAQELSGPYIVTSGNNCLVVTFVTRNNS